MSEEIIEGPNILLKAISEAQAAIIIFLVVFIAFSILLYQGKMSVEDYKLLLATDGLLASVLALIRKNK